jgi:23S rRNA (guanosine2251-2'-O)-methyltransferase
MPVIYGIHAVTEALKARGRGFEYVAVSRERHDGRLHRVLTDCRAAGVPVRSAAREELDRLAAGGAHQGVVAVTSEKQYVDLDDLLASRRGRHAFLLVLDGVEDPHNLGAILRTADAAGVDGIIIPERRAVGVTGTVAKASAGASEHVPITRVTNISRTVEELKKRNVWTVGLDERGGQSYDAIDYAMDCALVLGAEGKGLHEQVRKHCDFLVSIPMQGRVPSLNVSVAAAVVMYEVARQRRTSTAKDAKERKGKP